MVLSKWSLQSFDEHFIHLNKDAILFNDFYVIIYFKKNVLVESETSKKQILFNKAVIWRGKNIS